MRKHILFIALLLVIKTGLTQNLTKEQKKSIEQFIDCIKNNDVNELKKWVHYPLNRSYPLSNIDSETEFKIRYYEVFDDSLRNIIISSNVETDWHMMGWRGIMLHDGILWLDDKSLNSVNYESKYEKKKKKELIKKDRNSLHESIKDYKYPVSVIETKKFRIRIDALENGKYRYTSWSINSKMSQEPDLILKNGEWHPDGSGGNHWYEFTNGKYKYKCSIIVLSSEDHPFALLQVYRNENELLRESGNLK